jgi:hypothetical protein
MRFAPCILLVLTLFSQVRAGAVGEANWPAASALRRGQAPVIDGRLGAEERQGATRLSGIVLLGGRILAAGGQPEARLAWLAAGLAIGIEIPLPPGEKAKAQATDWDGTVWQDDSVEVHVDPDHGHKRSYQFVVNALGTRLDSRGGDLRYNAEWQAAAVNQPGRWTAEFLIPWAALEASAPTAGQTLGLNLAVNASHLGGILTWAPLTGGLHAPAQFAHLTLATDTAVSLLNLEARRLAELRVEVLGTGSAEVSWTLDRRAAPDRLESLCRESRTVSAAQALPLPVSIPLANGFPKAGSYALKCVAASGGRVLLQQAVELEVGASLELRAQAFLREPRLGFTVRADPVAFPPAASKITLTVSGPAGVILEEKRAPAADTGEVRLELAGDQVPAGRLTVRAEAVQRLSGVRGSAERVLESPLKPVWLGTSEGLSREVPAPWTPLKTRGSAVYCWERCYRFERSPFPTEITARAAALLAGPIRLTGACNGTPIAWKGEHPRMLEDARDRVSMAVSATAPGLALAGVVTVEYDGMVRIDATLTPAAGQATLRDLTLEIPLLPERARYLYHFPGQWGSVANSGFLPSAGWSHAFKPFVWLGDEDRGLAWFCESERNWFPPGAADALTIQREDKAVVLRCHLIRGELAVSRPLEYTFGFQATPVKEPEKTVWDYRITHHGSYGLESQPATVGGTITYPAEGHLSASAGTFECWYRPAFENQERGVPRKDRRNTTNRSIFTLKWDADPAGGSNCGLYWNEQVQGPVAWSRRQGTVLLNPGAAVDWKAGQWLHLALTWSDQVRLYVDGKLVAETANTGFIPEPLGKAVIELGGAQAMALLDEVRILSTARPPTLNPGPVVADAETLLLDSFEGYGKGGTGGPGKAAKSVAFTAAKFGQGASWDPASNATQLQRLVEAGVRTICFHEHWSPYQSHPYVTAENRPRLRRLADACREADVDLLLYMSRQFADNAPEWELYADEVLQLPRSGAYRRQPEQKAYIACWNSAWKDFCLYYLGKTLDEFKHGGWYLDGPEWPMPCNNPHHGCGYLAPDGSRRPVYDIFATREFMKRLYVLTRQRNPQGQLNIHNSTVMVIPTLAWGTSTWGGEQIDAIKPPVKTLDILPMDAFRTEFMGRQWGIPAEFLVYEGQPYHSRDVLAYTLLHGVLIRPGGGDPESLERTAALWRVYDAFPFGEATLYPYWNNAERLTCTPAGVYATAYERPREGLLLFVSNLGEASAAAAVSLNLKAFGWESAATTDALSGAALPGADGVLRFPLEAWRYRVLRVRPP